MPFKADSLKKRNLRTSLALGPMLIAVIAALACSTLGQEPTSTIPAATATTTPTSTPTPTPTPTPIPPPQGVWSSYWSNNEVVELEQDGEGYLWARGSASVMRWDLAERTYQEFGVSQGLPANVAQSMFIGPQGHVWLSFAQHGLWRFDDPGWTPFVEQGVGAGAHAIGPNEELWICTDEGLSKFQDEVWQSYQMTGGMADGFCEYLTVDNQGNPWMQGTYGISTFHEPDDWVLYDSIVSAYGRQMNFRTPIGAFTAPDGNVWFAYWGDHVIWYDGQDWHTALMRPGNFALSSTGQPWVVVNGLLALSEPDDIITYVYGNHPRFDLGDEPVWVSGYYWPMPFFDRMPTEELGEIYSGINGEMWITSPDGLVRIRGSSISLIRVEVWRGLSRLQDLEVTMSGEIYLAQKDGIARLSGDQLIPLRAEENLIGNLIYEIDVAPNGTLWSYSSNGLQSFNGASWTRHSAPSFAADMAIAPNGEVWLAHRHLGVSRWDGSSWDRFEPGSVPGYLDGSVDALAIGADGVVWLGIKEVGVSSYDGSQWTAYPFDEGMLVPEINDLIIDGNGDVFLVSDAHLHRLSAGAWTTEVIQEAGEALAMGPDGSVYLGTRMGGVFKVGEGEWNSMNLAAGLPFERIDDLEFGPDGSMYLGTDNGAWRFDGNQWESFLPEDALRSDEVRLIAVGMDNTIWFGGLGLARFGAPLSQ